MTAHAMRGACEEYLAAGMDDYITKPFQPALLLAKLDRLAEVFAAQRAAAPAAPGAAVLDPPIWKNCAAALPPESLAGLITLFLHDAECQLAGNRRLRESGRPAGIAARRIC